MLGRDSRLQAPDGRSARHSARGCAPFAAARAIATAAHPTISEVQSHGARPRHWMALLHDFFAAALHRGHDRVALEIPPDDRGRNRVCVTYHALAAAADALVQQLTPHLRR